MLDRRRFLGLGTAAAAAPGALSVAVHGAEAGPPRVRRYVTLGRTGLEVSDVSFGSSSSADPALVRYAFERGINFFDTAESYRGGRAEEAIGEGLQGIRDKVVIASKTRARAGATRDDMMRSLEGSLTRLRTDHVDIYFNHAVDDVDRMRNPEWAEFTERAIEQGKIRFRGMSGHGSRLVECLDYAIAQDLVDVVLVAYNFGQDPNFYAALRDVISFPAHQPDLPRPLAAAKERNVGVLAMKVLMGARRNDMRPFERDGTTFAQAALRWVLSGGDVHSALISMNRREDVDEYLGGSGAMALREGDLDLLARYAHLQHSRYCRHGCDACLGACPEGVSIAEVLRTRMYAVDYENELLARTDYAKLGGGASACLTCAHQACASACVYGLPIATLTRDAAVRLG